MAKKKGGGEEKKEEPKKGFIEGLIAAYLGGKLDEETKKKAAEILNGDAGFLRWWQRNSGESIVSAQNVLKAIGLLGSYAVYNHLDPLKDSKVDNAGVLVTVIALGVLLLVPQTNELGAHFKNFEGGILKKLLEAGALDEERKKVLQWIRNLSNRQESKLNSLLKGMDAAKIVEALEDDGTRTFIKELLGEDPKSMSAEEILKKAREIHEKYWPKTKKAYHAADQTVADGLRTFRGWLNAKGVRR